MLAIAAAATAAFFVQLLVTEAKMQIDYLRNT
jgi:hypothetical protein